MADCLPFSATDLIPVTAGLPPLSASETKETTTEDTHSKSQHGTHGSFQQDEVIVEQGQVEAPSATNPVGTHFPMSSLMALMYGNVACPGAPFAFFPQAMPLRYQSGFVSPIANRSVFPIPTQHTIGKQSRLVPCSPPRCAVVAVKEKRKRGRPKGRRNNKTLVRLEEEKRRKELEQERHERREEQAEGAEPVQESSESEQQTEIPKTAKTARKKLVSSAPKRQRRVIVQCRKAQTRRSDGLQRRQTTIKDTDTVEAVDTNAKVCTDDTLSKISESRPFEMALDFSESDKLKKGESAVEETPLQRKLRLNAEAAKRCRLKRSQEWSQIKNKCACLQRDVDRLCAALTAVGATIPDNLESRLGDDVCLDGMSSRKRRRTSSDQGTSTKTEEPCEDMDEVASKSGERCIADAPNAVSLANLSVEMMEDFDRYLSQVELVDVKPPSSEVVNCDAL